MCTSSSMYELWDKYSSRVFSFREEPDAEATAEDNVSISGILQFRNSLAFLNNDYMFSKFSIRKALIRIVFYLLYLN
jgi:hypothetical protein